MFDPFDEHHAGEVEVHGPVDVRCTVCARNAYTTHDLDQPAECDSCGFCYCKECRSNAGTCPTCEAAGYVTRWAS